MVLQYLKAFFLHIKPENNFVEAIEAAIRVEVHLIKLRRLVKEDNARLDNVLLISALSELYVAYPEGSKQKFEIKQRLEAALGKS